MSRQDQYMILFPKNPTVVYLDTLVRVINQIRGYHNQNLLLDLSQVTQVSPIFLCLLASAIYECAVELGNSIEIKYPESRRAADILRKAKFMEGTPERIESQFLQVRRLDANGALWIHDVIELIGDNLHISEGLREMMRVLLSELFQNAIDHSGREMCYVCAGVWGRSPQVHISVVDFGVGMPNKLRSKYVHDIGKDDTKALELVLEQGRTTRERRVGGKGYLFIQEFLRTNGGRLCVYSGNAKASYRFDRGEYPIKDKRTFFAGTCVDIQINRDKHNYYSLMSESKEVFF